MGTARRRRTSVTSFRHLRMGPTAETRPGRMTMRTTPQPVCCLSAPQSSALIRPAQHDLFNVHFGVKSPYLSPDAITAAEQRAWSSKRVSLEGYGQFVEQTPANGVSPASVASSSRVSPISVRL